MTSNTAELQDLNVQLSVDFQQQIIKLKHNIRFVYFLLFSGNLARDVSQVLKMLSYWLSLLFSQKRLKYLLFIATVAIATGYDLNVQAQLTPDDSLGEESSVVTPNVEVKGESADRIDGGAIRDRNLFHSFSELNVGEAQRVYFANPDNIEQIFTRVTGSNPSNINGTFGVDGAADLLLLNPNGIIFGENSSLDVEGSFFGTTADSVLFEDGEEFSATEPNSSLLTVSVPLGLQVGNNPGAIEVRSPLTMANGQNFSLVGGEINLKSVNVNTDDNGTNSAGDGIIAPGGRVELGGLATVGRVNFGDSSNLNFPENVTKANITLDNYFINASAGGEGAIALQSQNLSLIDSFIITGINSGVESTDAQAGDITINTAKATIIEASKDSQSAIFNLTGTDITGDLAEFDLETDNLEAVNVAGNAGNIFINTDRLSVTGYSVIFSLTNGEGNAGNVNIDARSSVFLDPLEPSESIAVIFSGVGELATGNGADININTSLLSLNNAGISTTAIGAGDAGNIVINATNSIDLIDSTISAETGSSGDAGNIVFESETANISLDNSGISTVVSLPTEQSVGTGRGGDITIAGQNLFATNDSVVITGTGGEVTAEGLANAGDLKLNITNSITLSNQSLFASSTLSEGNAGNIIINANQIKLLGNSEADSPSAISADTFGSGNGGTISITTNNLFIRDKAIVSVSSSEDGNAGAIFASINDSLELNSGEIGSLSSRSSGGDISIDAGSISLTGDSNIRTNVENGIGGGGNITLSADSIVAFDDSDIVASSADGRGGNITLDTDAFFASPFNSALLNSDPQFLNDNNRVDLSATGSVDGTIDIPEVNFLPNNLVKLSEETIDSEEVVANSCVVRSTQPGGTFIVTGSGGLPMRPADATVSDYATGTVRAIPEKETSEEDNRKPKSIAEPEGVYRLANGKLVLSRECR